jgi:lipoprotein-anchoring transpeptidase ErfK/SrfK
VKRIAIVIGLLSIAAAGFLAASVLAGAPLGPLTDSTTSTTGTTATTSTTGPTTTVPTTTTTAPKPKPKPKPKPPTRLARRITIGGVHVGGLTPAAALAAVRLAFHSPLIVSVDGARVPVAPERLGARAYVEAAVRRATAARAGTAVPLVVTVNGAAVRAWVAHMADNRDREVRDAHAALKGLRPVIVSEHDGYLVHREPTVLAIVEALRANKRGPVRAVASVERAEVKSDSITSVIVIRRGSNRLYYYKRDTLGRVFTVATGQSAYPTPLGNFAIAVMWRDPWWYPPPSPWAKGLKPVPPGPGNPLGTRWMGLTAPAVGIHGTPDAASLGYSASHGCIRMAIPDAEWLFRHVKVGTPVFIVPV